MLVIWKMDKSRSTPILKTEYISLPWEKICEKVGFEAGVKHRGSEDANRVSDNRKDLTSKWEGE